MKKLPKISIVIPSYNKAKYIQETLESIVSQKYANLEVIIQDGGSTDGTLEIIKKYAKKYPKIISWVSKKDKGQTDAINKGLIKARGEVLTYINADDLYEAGSLLRVGEAFEKNPKAKWLAGKGKVINRDEIEVAGLFSKYKNFLLKINRYTTLLMVNYLIQPSVFLRKESYSRHGPFIGVGETGIVMEYDLWLKLGNKSMPLVVDNYLSSFRLVDSGFSLKEYKKVLRKDNEIVNKYTKNYLLLWLHYLHNMVRILTTKFL